MRYLRQSTSADVGIGPFLDETDGKTAETALTITQPDIRLKKNGGDWAQKAAAQTLTHEEAGWYEVTLDATDTNTVGALLVAVHESGALPVWHEFCVIEEAVYDALFAASAAGYGTAQTGDSFARLGAPVGASISADIAGVQSDTNDIQTRLPAALTGAGNIKADALFLNGNTPNNLSGSDVRTAVGLASANLDTQLSAIAGYIDTETAAILAAVDTEVAAIKAKTDNLPAAPAATGDIPTAAQNADALLGRNVAGGSSTGRTVSQALFALRNKVAIAAGTLTVYSTDDVTPSWTAALTTDGTADPITAVDPG